VESFGTLANLHNMLMIPFFVSSMYSYKVQPLPSPPWPAGAGERGGAPAARHLQPPQGSPQLPNVRPLQELARDPEFL
jgi:hypothetical protein